MALQSLAPNITSLFNHVRVIISYFAMKKGSGGIIGVIPVCHFKTGPDSSVGRVSAPENGRSRVRSRAATYQSRKKMVVAAPRLALRLTG